MCSASFHFIHKISYNPLKHFILRSVPKSRSFWWFSASWAIWAARAVNKISAIFNPYFHGENFCILLINIKVRKMSMLALRYTYLCQNRLKIGFSNLSVLFTGYRVFKLGSSDKNIPIHWILYPLY